MLCKRPLHPRNPVAFTLPIRWRSVRLRDQLDMDLMGFLDIVIELRTRYKVEVPKEEYPTLRSCVEYLTPKLQAAAVL